MAFAVIPGQELIFEVYDPVELEFVAVDGITNLDLGDGQTAFTDISDFSTTGFKDEVPGIRSIGNTTLAINYYPSDPGQTLLLALWASGETVDMKATFTTGDICSFEASVDNFNCDAAGVNDNKVTGSFTFNSGDQTWSVAP